MPRASLVCEKKLVDLGVRGSIATISEYQVELFLMENDVLSMEMASCFRRVYVDNDMTSLFHVATAILKLQTLYGIIPNIHGQGKAAKHVADLIIRLQSELGNKGPNVAPMFDSIILLDRSVDLITPLVTQLTYEGLIDEIYGINNNHVKLPSEKFTKMANEEKSGEQASEFKQFVLTSNDELFGMLRDKNFNAVGPVIKSTVQNLKALEAEKDRAKTVQELKQFVDKIPLFQAQRKTVSQHTVIAELVKVVSDEQRFRQTIEVEQEFLNCINTDKICPFIEDCIGRSEDIGKVLRLICLQSLTNSGLKPKVLEFYKREILQTYGFEHILTLQNLEKSGLLKVATLSASYLSIGVVVGKANYNTIRKALKLNAQEVNEQSPTDINYVHSGYAPASARLIQFQIRPGWRAISDLLRNLPEPTVEEVQSVPAGLRRRRNSGSSSNSYKDERRTVLVFFIGGCTFAEISALRFLSRHEELNVDFVVATTKLINGTSFLDSLSEKIEVKDLRQ
ncbi:Vacuolar protein sorting-associated protein 33A [Halotydeus destructor]|nr:Vacuolar protein sorting-associated protein 33A [Halotydeus destructor]